MFSERLPWIGQDPASQKLFELAQRAAPVPTTILISGENGSGKNHLARLIHELGPRRDTPFLKIESSSLPSVLVEAELFGYERGGFPGGGERKIGAFELGLKGTIVVDEISLLSASAQERLLRVLEERRVERIGGKESVVVDARLIALTSADMVGAVKAGGFSEELYHQLDMAKIWMEPLRERPADILPLAEHFLAELQRERGGERLQLGETAKAALQAYRWPENVAELRGVLRRGAMEAKTSTVEAELFPTEIQMAGKQRTGAHLRPLEEVEREAIEATLEATEYQIGRSAEILGISRKTLLEKRKKFGMK